MTRNEWAKLSLVEQETIIEKYVDEHKGDLEDRYEVFHQEYGDAAAFCYDWIRYRARDIIEEALEWDDTSIKFTEEEYEKIADMNAEELDKFMKGKGL